MTTEPAPPILPPSIPLPAASGLHPVATFRPRTLTHALAEVATSLARLTTVALFIVTFLLQPFQIPSGSMERTLLIGDFVLVNKQVFAPAGHWRWLLPYRDPRPQSLVVFHYPVQPDELLVKRIVGIPGDRLHLRDNQLYRNGQPQTEPFAQYRPAGRSSFRDRFPNLQEADPSVEAAWWTELRRRIHAGDLPIPPGRYFAMGDNRNNSQDSRFWGFVPRPNIVGEPLLVYISLDHSPGTRPHLRHDRLLRILH